MKLSRDGYKRNSKDVNNPYNVIPSGDITMKGVDFPVMGTDNLGNQQLMQPGFDYKFPGNMVFEQPVQDKPKNQVKKRRTERDNKLLPNWTPEMGDVSSYLMTTMQFTDDDGSPIYIAIPMLYPTIEGQETPDPSSWTEFSKGDEMSAFEMAMERGEVYYFNSAEEADAFAKGGYKTPNLKKRDGGSLPKAQFQWIDDAWRWGRSLFSRNPSGTFNRPLDMSSNLRFSNQKLLKDLNKPPKLAYETFPEWHRYISASQPLTSTSYQFPTLVNDAAFNNLINDKNLINVNSLSQYLDKTKGLNPIQLYDRQKIKTVFDDLNLSDQKYIDKDKFLGEISKTLNPEPIFPTIQSLPMRSDTWYQQYWEGSNNPYKLFYLGDKPIESFTPTNWVNMNAESKLKWISENKPELIDDFVMPNTDAHILQTFIPNTPTVPMYDRNVGSSHFAPVMNPGYEGALILGHNRVMFDPNYPKTTVSVERQSDYAQKYNQLESNKKGAFVNYVNTLKGLQPAGSEPLKTQELLEAAEKNLKFNTEIVEQINAGDDVIKSILEKEATTPDWWDRSLHEAVKDFYKGASEPELYWNLFINLFGNTTLPSFNELNQYQIIKLIKTPEFKKYIEDKQIHWKNEVDKRTADHQDALAKNADELYNIENPSKLSSELKEYRKNAPAILLNELVDYSTKLGNTHLHLPLSSTVAKTQGFDANKWGAPNPLFHEHKWTGHSWNDFNNTLKSMQERSGDSRIWPKGESVIGPFRIDVKHVGKNPKQRASLNIVKRTWYYTPPGGKEISMIDYMKKQDGVVDGKVGNALVEYSKQDVLNRIQKIRNEFLTSKGYNPEVDYKNVEGAYRPEHQTILNKASEEQIKKDIEQVFGKDYPYEIITDSRGNQYIRLDHTGTRLPIKKMHTYKGGGEFLPKAQFNYFTSNDGRSNLEQSSKLAGTVFLADFLTRAGITGFGNRKNYKDAYSNWLDYADRNWSESGNWYNDMCTTGTCPAVEENRLNLLGKYDEPTFQWFKDQDNLIGKQNFMGDVLEGNDLLNAYWQDAKRAGKDALYTGAINYGLNWLGDRTKIGRNVSDWWQDKNLPTLDIGYLSRQDGGSLPKAQLQLPRILNTGKKASSLTNKVANHISNPTLFKETYHFNLDPDIGKRLTWKHNEPYLFPHSDNVWKAALDQTREIFGSKLPSLIGWDETRSYELLNKNDKFMQMLKDPTNYTDIRKLSELLKAKPKDGETGLNDPWWRLVHEARPYEGIYSPVISEFWDIIKKLDVSHPMYDIEDMFAGYISRLPETHQINLGILDIKKPKTKEAGKQLNIFEPTPPQSFEQWKKNLQQKQAGGSLSRFQLPKAQFNNIEAENEATDYMKNYLYSDLFKRRVEDVHGEENYKDVYRAKMDALNNVIMNATDPERWKDIFDNPVTLFNFQKNLWDSKNLQATYRGKNNEITYNTEQALDEIDHSNLSYNPLSSIIVNEYAHALGAMGSDRYFPFIMTEREKEIARKRKKGADPDDHDKKEWEVKSDIETTRFELYKNNKYDLNDKNFKFDKSHIKFIKDNPDKFIKDKNLFDNYDDDVILEMMNTFTDNSSIPLGMAKYGGSLPKAQLQLLKLRNPAHTSVNIIDKTTPWTVFGMGSKYRNSGIPNLVTIDNRADLIKQYNLRNDQFRTVNINDKVLNDALLRENALLHGYDPNKADELATFMGVTPTGGGGRRAGFQTTDRDLSDILYAGDYPHITNYRYTTGNPQNSYTVKSNIWEDDISLLNDQEIYDRISLLDKVRAHDPSRNIYDVGMIKKYSSLSDIQVPHGSLINTQTTHVPELMQTNMIYGDLFKPVRTPISIMRGDDLIKSLKLSDNKFETFEEGGDIDSIGAYNIYQNMEDRLESELLEDNDPIQILDQDFIPFKDRKWGGLEGYFLYANQPHELTEKGYKLLNTPNVLDDLRNDLRKVGIEENVSWTTLDGWDEYGIGNNFILSDDGTLYDFDYGPFNPNNNKWFKHNFPKPVGRKIIDLESVSSLGPKLIEQNIINENIIEALPYELTKYKDSEYFQLTRVGHNVGTMPKGDDGKPLLVMKDQAGRIIWKGTTTDYENNFKDILVDKGDGKLHLPKAQLQLYDRARQIIPKIKNTYDLWKYNKAKDLFGNTGKALSSDLTPNILKNRSLMDYKALANTTFNNDRLNQIMADYTVDSGPFKFGHWKDSQGNPVEMHSALSVMRGPNGEIINATDNRYALELADFIKNNRLTWKNRTNTELNKPLSLTRMWNENESISGIHGNINDLKLSLKSGEPIQLGDITSWSAGKAGLNAFGEHRYVIKDFDFETPALLNEYNKYLSKNQQNVWKEREILLGPDTKFAVKNIIENAPRTPSWDLITSLRESNPKLWDDLGFNTPSGSFGSPNKYGAYTFNYNPMEKIWPQGQTNPWYDKMQILKENDPKFKIQASPNYGTDVELEILKKYGGSLPKAQIGGIGIFDDVKEFETNYELTDYPWLNSLMGRQLNNLSHALDVLSVPSALVAEAMEATGNKDYEFNFSDAMPGFKGDFSGTSWSGNKMKSPSEIKGYTYDGDWGDFAKALSYDIFYDPLSYVGVGILRTLAQRSGIKGGVPAVKNYINGLSKPDQVAFINKFAPEKMSDINFTRNVVDHSTNMTNKKFNHLNTLIENNIDLLPEQQKLLANKDKIVNTITRNMSNDLKDGYVNLYRYGSSKKGIDHNWYSSDPLGPMDYSNIRHGDLDVHVVKVKVEDLPKYYANKKLADKSDKFAENYLKGEMSNLKTQYQEFFIPDEILKDAKTISYDTYWNNILDESSEFYKRKGGELLKAQTQTELDILNANIEADKWNKEYVQSDNYMSMLRRAKEKESVINSRIAEAMNFDPYKHITYDVNNPSLGQYYNTSYSTSSGETYPPGMHNPLFGENMLNYNPTLFRNHPAYNNPDIATGGWPALAGHELIGHYGVDKLNRKQRKALNSLINWEALDNFAGDSDEAYDHGKDVYEMRANLAQLRYQLDKAGIYDSKKGLAVREDGEEGDNPFTEEHLKQILEFDEDGNFIRIKPEFNNEILQFVAPQDIIWMMNNIAQNQEIGDDLSEGMLRAKMGAELTKFQERGSNDPGWLARRLYNSVTPIGYNLDHAIKEMYHGSRQPFMWDGIKTSFDDFQNHPRFQEQAMFPGQGDYIKNASQDLWGMYLGFDQKNNTVSKSKFKPTRGVEDSDAIYYSFNDVRDIWADIVDDHHNNGVSIISDITKDNWQINDSGAGGFNLANYQISKGEDKEKELPYFAYYDEYDFDIPTGLGFNIPGENIIGKPFEIYGRIYYNPETMEMIPENEVKGWWVDFEKLKQGVSYAESLDGELMINPQSTATGRYGQLFSEINDIYDGSRTDFANDLDAQEDYFENRYRGKIKGVPGLRESAIDLYQEYHTQIKNFPYSTTEVAGLVHFLGRQGAREYLGYVLRDGNTLESVFPDKYGPNAGQANKTPQEYIEKFNEGITNMKQQNLEDDLTEKLIRKLDRGEKLTPAGIKHLESLGMI